MTPETKRTWTIRDWPKFLKLMRSLLKQHGLTDAQIQWVLGDEEEAVVRRCGCGKLLTPEEIQRSQGWHCHACWEKLMREMPSEEVEP